MIVYLMSLNRACSESRSFLLYEQRRFKLESVLFQEATNISKTNAAKVCSVYIFRDINSLFPFNIECMPRCYWLYYISHDDQKYRSTACLRTNSFLR